MIATMATTATIAMLATIGVAAQAAAAGAEAVPRLDENAQQALTVALEDERNSKAFYEAVMARHGKIAPFRNIANAETRHALAIERIFERYEVSVPASAVPTKFDVPETVVEACTAALAAERENAALYEGLMETVDQKDIRRTFTKLRSVSLENHVPAFEHCAAGGKDFARFAPGACSGGCGMGEAACGCGAAATPKEPARVAGGCGCAARRAAEQAAQQAEPPAEQRAEPLAE